MANILASERTAGDRGDREHWQHRLPATSSDERHVRGKRESLLDPPPVRFLYG
jgi:hypothetical protein